MTPNKPRFFYGYVLVGVCFLILFQLYGITLNALPVFLKPIARDMDWGRGDFMVALIVGSLGTAIGASVAGKLMDKFGARLIMGIGAILIGICSFGLSRVNHLIIFYGIFFITGMGIMSATIVPCSLILSNWFVSRRGTAMSIAFLGTAFGGAMAGPINWIIESYGWRAAFALNGTIILAIIGPVIFLLIRTHPSEMGLEPYRNKSDNDTSEENGPAWGFTVREALRLPIFWQIAAIMLIIGILQGTVTNHSIAYLDDMLHSSQTAANVWTFTMVMMAIGKFCFGPAADKLGTKKTMSGACLMFAVSACILSFARSMPVAIAFGFVYGLAAGGPLVLNALLTGNYLGMKNFGAIYGLLNMGVLLAGSFAPAAAGFYFDKTGTYLPAFYVIAAIMIGGFLITLSLRPEKTTERVIGNTQPAAVD